MRNLLAIIALIISYNALAVPSFEILCQTKQTEEVEKTIRAIFSALRVSTKNINSSTCASAAKRLHEVKSLDLSDMDISDLHPLARLTNLESLNLSHNKIENLWPLVDLVKIHTLILSSNKITDISALSSIKNVQILDLSSNGISNILPIKDLYNLRIISLENNPVFTSVSNERAEEIKGLLSSLIWFRSHFTLSDYAPLDLGDAEETAELLNNRAARGDLGYFRSLIECQGKNYVFNDVVNIWTLLTAETKKIMIAVSASEELAQILFDELRKVLESHIDGNDESITLRVNRLSRFESVYKKQEHVFEQIKRIIEYFMAENVRRAPYSFSDKKLFIDFFKEYAKKMDTKLQKPRDPFVVFSVFFSPQFVARELAQFGKKLEKSRFFYIQSGFKTGVK